MVAYQKKMRLLFIGFVLVVLIMVFTAMSSIENMFSLMFMVSAALIIFAIIWSRMTKKLSGMYRESIIKVALEETFDNFIYEPNQGLSKSVVYDTDLFPKGNTYQSNDLVRLNLNGNTIEIADVLIQDVTSDDNGTHVTEYFSGKWLIMTSKKAIDSKLYIIDRDNKYSKPKGWLFKGKELETVKMESIHFNNRFRVYASSPHDAFYILTPQMIEGVLAMDHHDLSVLQERNVTHVVAKGSKPFLNISIFSSLDENMERERVKEQFKTIVQFIQFYGKESEGVS